MTGPTISDAVGLAERCEQATGPDRELDEAIHTARFPDHPRNKTLREYYSGYRETVEVPTYTASIDAAMTLVPVGLCWRLGVNGNPKAKLLGGSAAAILGADFGWDIAKAGAATPALALCAATLRARAATGEAE